MTHSDDDCLSIQERFEVRNVLAQYWWPLPHSIDAMRMVQGHCNRVYRIRRGDDEYVLRRYDYNHTRNVILYEHNLLMALPEKIHSAMVAKPLYSLQSETLVSIDRHNYILIPFVKGDEYDRRNILLLREAGTTLAAYHSVVRDYLPSPRQRPTYGSVACLDWVAQHTGGVVPLWHATTDLPIQSEHDRFIYDSVNFLATEEVVLRRALTRSTVGDVVHLVTHSDFGPRNLLSNGDRVVGLLDFDVATWDARVYDLAMALVLLGNDPDRLPPLFLAPSGRGRAWSVSVERALAVLHGYVARVMPPLTQAEIELIPWFMLAVPLLFVVWSLDRRVAGLDWYPDETIGCIAFMRWFRTRGEAFAAAIVKSAAAHGATAVA